MPASSPILSPVWSKISTMAYILMSSRQTSRRARYSRGERTWGGVISYLGWATALAGEEVTMFSKSRYLKSDLTELSLRETLLRVYCLFLRSFLKPSRCSVVIAVTAVTPRLSRYSMS